MPASYVVRRGDAYHFRLRVPVDLRAAMGTRELHSSLGHARRKAAEQRAAFLAFHAHAFFGMVRRLMRTMTPDEIAALVDDWRRRMLERDGEVRRAIELDMHDTAGMAGYIGQCDASSDLADETLAALVPSREDGDEIRHPSKREQQRALAFAREWITSDDDAAAAIGHVPLMTAAEFDALDPITAKDIARRFLAAASGVYAHKAAAVDRRAPEAGAKSPQAPKAAGAVVSAEGGHASATADQTAAAQAHGPAPAAKITIGEAWRAYCAKKARRDKAWKNGVPDNARKAWPTFAAVMGEDAPLGTINVPSLRRFQRIAENMPKMNVLPYRAMPIGDVVALAAQGDIPEDDRRVTSTLDNLLSEIRVFLVNYCTVDCSLYLPAGFKFDPAGRARDEDEDASYEPWTTKDIQRMFDPAQLGAQARKCRANATSRANPRTTFPDGAQWADWPWLLLVALYTGARLSELVGLTFQDVCAAHGETRAQGRGDVPVLLIRKNTHRGLKNAASERCVPIHPDLIAMGFLDLVAQRETGGDARLFRTVGTVVVGGKKVSEALAEFAYAMGTRQDDERKVFHSFRHTFKTQANGAFKGKGDALDGVTGHKRKGSEMTRYEHGLLIPQHDRAACMAQVTFGLDVEGLRVMLAELQAEVGR